MNFEYGTPFVGRKLSLLQTFLERMGLRYDTSINFTVNLTEGEEILATGSLSANVLKCIAVSSNCQGQDFLAKIVTELQKEAFRQGRYHLFLYTKPQNGIYFSQMGFYPIAQIPDVMMMENSRNGLSHFLQSLGNYDCTGNIGAVVANCNPFTNGHRYLIASAAKQCDLLHVFVLSEEQSQIPADDRLQLVRLGTQEFPNVVVHPTSDYLISRATFPEYFLPKNANTNQIHCLLDLEIFASRFAPALGITRRFVGTEPFSAVTALYHRIMKSYLPSRGITVTEIPRLQIGATPISATNVRKLWLDEDWESLEPLVPPTTMTYLKTHKPAQR